MLLDPVRRFVRGFETVEVSVVDNELLTITSTESDREFDTKTYENPTAARRAAEATIKAKRAEGFVELDADGAPLEEARPTQSVGASLTRWDCRKGTVRRLAILDHDELVVGPHTGLERYSFDTSAEAKRYVEALLDTWSSEGFRIGEAERIRATDVPLATGPKAPPPLNGAHFEGTVEVVDGTANVTLSFEQETEGASLLGFRDLVRRLAAEDVNGIRIDAEQYVPDDLLMKAIAETSLPSVQVFSFESLEYRGPYLGDLRALFRGCPNLVAARVQGGGALRPFAAEHLQFLNVWDGSMDAGFGEALAKSQTPSLIGAAFDLRTCARVSAEEVRAWLESAAPELRGVLLHNVLGPEGFEGMLAARAPNLTEVNVGNDTLEAYLEPIAALGLPEHWSSLQMSADHVDDDDASLELLARCRDALQRLQKLELTCEFDMGGAEARARLESICPNLVYDDGSDE